MTGKTTFKSLFSITVPLIDQSNKSYVDSSFSQLVLASERKVSTAIVKEVPNRVSLFCLLEMEVEKS